MPQSVTIPEALSTRRKRTRPRGCELPFGAFASKPVKAPCATTSSTGVAGTSSAPAPTAANAAARVVGVALIPVGDGSPFRRAASLTRATKSGGPVSVDVTAVEACESAETADTVFGLM